MGNGTKPVCLAMSFRETAIARKRLGSFSKCMRAIAESRRQGLVTTCRQLWKFSSAVICAINVRKPPALAKGTGYNYTMLWFMRSLLIASGVQQLNVNNTIVEVFCSAFSRCQAAVVHIPPETTYQDHHGRSVLFKETRVVHYVLCV